MKKVLITGASGYLGMHLCNEICKTNYATIGLFKTNKPSVKNIEFVQNDISDAIELRKLFEFHRFDLVYHLAAVTPVTSVDSSEDYIRKINVEATNDIIKLANEFNSHLIFTSTDLVYSEGDDLGEDSQLNPLTIYSKIKVEAEELIKQFAKQYLILRTALMYGFTLSEHRSFFDTSFEMLKRGEKVEAFSDQFRNALFVEDAARLLLEIPFNKAKNQTINFCGREKLSRYDMVKMVIDIFEFDPNLLEATSSDKFKDYPMVKNLGLNFDKMNQLNLIPNLYLENLKYLKKNINRYF